MANGMVPLAEVISRARADIDSNKNMKKKVEGILMISEDLSPI